MYQKLIIAGNLGSDPEMRYMPNGDAVTNFSVATNERWTDRDGERQERTTWFRVSAWRKLAEICNEYLSKGRPVIVEGQLEADPQTGGPKTFQRQDGTVGTSFTVIAREVKFLGGTASDSSLAGQPAGEPEADEVPF